AAFAVVAGLGGVFEGMYTVAFISISRDRRAQSLSSLNALFVAACALGEVVGPVGSGVSMRYLGPNGIVVVLCISVASYVLVMLNRLIPKTPQFSKDLI